MKDNTKNLDISKFENIEKPIKEKTTTTKNLLYNVDLELSAILGETDIPLKQILNLTKGSIIKLDNNTSEPIKLLANGTEIAKGEVVIIEDNFGLRITEISNKNIVDKEDNGK